MNEERSNALTGITDKLGDWKDILVDNFPNIVLAIVVFLITYVISRLLKKVASKALSRIAMQTSVRNLASSMVSVVIISLGLFLALSILKMDGVLKSLLAGAGIVGLALGLALQGALSNTFSGISLSVSELINIGDWIQTNGHEGQVTEIGLRNTKILGADNNIVVIPNKEILDNSFKNTSLTKQIRTVVKCGVAYDSDLEKVKELVKSTIQETFPIKGQEPQFHYLEFGASSIDFQIRFWVDATAEITAIEARSKAIIAIKKAFDANGIEIPFPIRTVIMDK